MSPECRIRAIETAITRRKEDDPRFSRAVARRQATRQLRKSSRSVTRPANSGYQGIQKTPPPDYNKEFPPLPPKPEGTARFKPPADTPPAVESPAVAPLPAKPTAAAPKTLSNGHRGKAASASPSFAKNARPQRNNSLGATLTREIYAAKARNGTCMTAASGSTFPLGPFVHPAQQLQPATPKQATTGLLPSGQFTPLPRAQNTGATPADNATVVLVRRLAEELEALKRHQEELERRIKQKEQEAEGRFDRMELLLQQILQKISQPSGTSNNAQLHQDEQNH